MIVGLDMGGTHIDGVIIKDNKIIKTIKNPSNKDNLFQTIWTAIEDLLSDFDQKEIKRINLSTTISTNAIVENRLSSVGMIIQSGPGLKNEFLGCGDENKFISGYVDHRGIVVEELNFQEIQDAISLFKENEIKSCAVITKFSTRNPEKELKIGHILSKEFNFITLGHRMSGKLNFPRRVFTSYLNSAIQDSFHSFSHNIRKSLEKKGIDAPLFILKADGGTMSLAHGEEKPVESILSGPAASFMGISSMIDTNEDAILLDIGGTTTDIFFLADGVALFEPLGIKIDKYNTLVRSIYSVSMGLGGDSAIEYKDEQLIIGPERQGKPYCFGGPMPTPTDAMVALGLIDVEDKIIYQRAEEAMVSLGNDLAMKVDQISKLVLDFFASKIKEKTDELLAIINSKPVYTVKELLDGKKLNPQSVYMIGGPASALSPVLEDHYKLPTYFPEHYQVANAIGAALAKPTMEITMNVDTARGVLSVPEISLYEKVDKNFTLQKAKNRAVHLLLQHTRTIDPEDHDIEIEIIEESSFNMVRGFSTTGKNMRIRAQVKPGHIFKLGGVNNDES